MPEQGRKRLVIIDGHSVLFRAYHAYPPLTTSTGELVNAVYGFTNILLSVIKDLSPTHIAVCFDRAAPTFRHKKFSGYKAHRPEAPEELVSQQGRVEEVLSVLNIPIFALEGYEADDLIATLVKKVTKVKTPAFAKASAGRQNSRLRQGFGGQAKVKNRSVEVVIVTGDRDAFQLIDGTRVQVYTPGRRKEKEKLWSEKAVVEAFHLRPAQVVDLKALAGDPSDEIPGVRGIGPKTAQLLLERYGGLREVYKKLSQVRSAFGERTYQKLAEGKKVAGLSRQLAQLAFDVPLKFSLAKCAVHDYDKAEAAAKLKELEFSSLLSKLPNDAFEQMVEEEMLGK